MAIPGNLLTEDAEGMETSAAGWVAGAGTFSRDATRARTGSASLKIVSAGSGDTFCYSNGNVTGLTAGVAYTGYAWVFTTLSGRSARVGWDWKNASNAYISSANSTAVTLTANAWTQVGPFTVTAPAGTTQATLYLPWATASASGQSYWFDDLFFGTPVTVTPFYGWGVPI